MVVGRHVEGTPGMQLGPSGLGDVGALSLLTNQGHEIGEGVVAVFMVLARAVRSAAVDRGCVVSRGWTQGCVVRKAWNGLSRSID